MIYLLDTNVISETVKKYPNKKVLDWISSIDAKKFAISVLTIGEIRKGIEKLEDTLKKQQIIQWLEIDLLKQFDRRIININSQVSDKWGYISAKTIIPAIDGLIAASALVHNLKLVTRNIKDFEHIENLELINPWIV